MSNYVEFDDKIAFHPRYYIEEMIDDGGLTQEDLAERLGITQDHLSILIRGEQSLSVDIATKLSEVLGTSVPNWLNLHRAFDERKCQ